MDLKDINYTIWCDFVERSFLDNEFKELVNNKIIYGATSNPAIFQQAFGNEIYKEQIKILMANEPKKIYEELAVYDIKKAAEILKPLHEEDSNDGFISIEVDPNFAFDSQKTIEEGLRLYSKIGYDNVMIKIPATSEGFIAMEELAKEGININATLIFSPLQAKLSAEAISKGMKKSSTKIKGVISVFVSRFDRNYNHKLNSLELEENKLGIINATKCYYEVNKINNSNIRTLFASTGVKDKNLDPSFYIKNLVYPNSINTAPLNTIKAYLDEEKKESKLISEDECNKYFDLLKEKKFDINSVYKELLDDGLEAFRKSFKSLLDKVRD